MLEERLLLTAAPSVVLSFAPITNQPTPWIELQASDDAGFAVGSMVSIDVDLNGDGDFADEGERDYQVVPVAALNDTIPLEWQSKFLPTTTVGPDFYALEFGRSIATSGQRAVIGAPAEARPLSMAGSVYVYEFDGSRWNQMAKLVGLDTDRDDRFGSSVAIDGDTIVVGAPGARDESTYTRGAVYVFELVQGEWTQTQKLIGTDPGSSTLGGRFGESVAIHGQTILVGDPFDTFGGGSAKGRAFVFERIAGTWERVATFSNNISAPGGRQFGSIVALSEDIAVVRGVEVVAGESISRMYTLEKIAGQWAMTDVLNPPTGTLTGGFGDTAQFEGGLLLLKTAIDDTPSAALYQRVGGEWVMEVLLKGRTETNVASNAVVMSGDRIVMELHVDGAADRSSLDSFEKINGEWVYAGRTDVPLSYPGIGRIGPLAMSGDIVLAGAYVSKEVFPTVSTGAIYSFAFNEGATTKAVYGAVVLAQSLADGRYYLRARVDDAEGREGGSAIIELVIDTQTPTSPVVTPASGATINTWSTTLRYDFVDVVTKVDASDLLLGGTAAAGAVVTGVSSALGGRSWLFNIEGLTDGILQSTLAPVAGDITDLAGNSLASVVNNHVVLDDQPPTVTAITPSPGALVTSGSINIDIAFSEAVVGFDASDLILNLSGAQPAVVGVPVRLGDTNQWRFPVSNLSSGTWSITLAPDAGDLTDEAGNNLAAQTWTYSIPGTGLSVISSQFVVPVNPAGPIPTTSDPSPPLGAMLNDPAHAYASGATVSLDIDLNGDSDFGDAGEQDAAISTLQLFASATHQATLSSISQGSVTIPGVAIRNGLAVVTVRDGGTGSTNTYGHVYQRTGESWSFVQELSSTTGGNNAITRAVAMTDTTIVIGSPRDNGSGILVIFELVAGVWTETALLPRPASTTGTLFGQSVSMSGDMLAVGMPSSSLNQFSGAVFLYQKSAGAWSLVDTVVSPDGQPNDYFGSSVSLDGNRLLVGAEGDDDLGQESGAAHLFDFDGAAWNHTAKFVSSAPAAQSLFGASVALDGEALVIGSLRSTQTSVYELRGGTWERTALLIDDESTTILLRRVAIDGQTIVVNAYRGNVFVRAGDQWVRSQKLAPPGNDSAEYFEGGTAIDGNDIILGGRVRLPSTSLGSGAQVYTLEPPGASGSNGVAVFDTPEITDGGHMVRARVTDVDGRENSSLAGYLNIDANPPAVASLSIEDGSTLESASIEFDVTFTKQVFGVDVTDLLLAGNGSGARVESVTQSSATVWHFTITGLHNGPLNLTLAPDANDIESIGGLDLSPTSWTYQIQNVEPVSVFAQNPDADKVIRTTGTFLDMYFTGRVKSVNVSDLVLTGSAAAIALIGTPIVVAPLADGSAYTWLFPVSNLRSGELFISLAPNAGDIVDTSGLPITSYVSQMIVDLSPVDSLHPVAPAGSVVQPTLVAGSDLSITLKFQLAVQSFDPSDVVLAGSASASAVVSGVTAVAGNPNTWKITIVGLNDGDLTVTIAPDENDVVNVYGDDLDPITVEYTVVAPPSVIIATPGYNAFVNQTSINLDLQLSEPISTPTANDLLLLGPAAQNATVATPIDMGNNLWRFPISGLVEGDLHSIFASNANGPRDASGNLPVVTTIAHVIDLTAPTGSFISPTPAGPYHLTDSMSLYLNLSEMLIGLDPSDIVLSGAAAVGAVFNTRIEVDGSGPYVYININHLQEGDLQINIAPDAGDLTDRAGNLFPTYTRSYIIDLVAPVIVGMTPGPGNISTQGGVNFDVTFSEPVTVNTTDAMVLTGPAALVAVVGAPIQLSPTVWRFPVTGIANGSLNVYVSGSNQAITDIAGRNAGPSITQQYTIQGGNTAPINFQITNASVLENQPVGTVVGLLVANDPNIGDTHTFSLVEGALSSDNAAFSIVGNQLRTNAIFDFEAKTNYFIRVRVTDQGGLFAESSLMITITDVQDSIAPVINGIYIAGGDWSQAYRDHLAALGIGTSLGYALASQGKQFLPLPWINLDQIHVVFSEDVVVQQSDLQLAGISVESHAVASFSYDANTFTGTWVFAAPIAADKLLLQVSDLIEDADGNALDGEWSGIDGWPSGDGLAGGDFIHRFDVLPGDVNQNQRVRMDDLIAVRNAHSQPWGSPSYRAMFDINGSATHDSEEVELVRGMQNTQLPTGEPVMPQSLIVIPVAIAANDNVPDLYMDASNETITIPDAAVVITQSNLIDLGWMRQLPALATGTSMMHRMTTNSASRHRSSAAQPRFAPAFQYIPINGIVPTTDVPDSHTRYVTMLPRRE